MKRNLLKGSVIGLCISICLFILWNENDGLSGGVSKSLANNKSDDLNLNLSPKANPSKSAKSSTIVKNDAKKASIEYVRDQVLLTFSKDVTTEQIDSVIKGVAFESISKISESAGIYLLKLQEGSSVVDTQITLKASKFVKSVERDMIYYTQTTPNDPQYAELWGLHNTGQSGGVADIDVNAFEAWDRLRGESEVVVAVIDTGVDYTHEDLVNNMWINPNEVAGNGIDDDNNGYIDDIYGIDTVNDDSDPMDDHYHGTHVAGTIGAEGNNGIGVVGVNWRTSIIACKFLSAGGSGSTSDAIECLDYLYDLKVNHGINIILSNNSWGGGGASPALEAAIALHRDAGIIFVAAAGNDASDNDLYPSYPSSYGTENIVSVAAIDRFGELADFSNYGETTVDIGAPGVNILSTIPHNGYDQLSGTSMAAPHVAGTLALMAADRPHLSSSELIELLYANSADLSSLSGKTVTGKQAKLDLFGIDTDEDGMPDWWEEKYALNSNDPNDANDDNDNDGLTNLEEFTYHTSPDQSDTDNDGLTDSEEVNSYSTNPTSADSDQDGLSDGEEVNTYSTDPLKRDSDSDGLNDGREVYSYGTDPTSDDSDSDGLGDGFEIQFGFDPLSNSGEQHEDADSDGLSNLNEFLTGSNPLMSDTDSDGLNDAEEVNVYATDPNNVDSDDDDLSDYDELIHYSTNPNMHDTDSDQIPDGYEVRFNLDPLFNDANNDPDYDQRSNYQEYLDGTNPFTPEVIDTEPNDTVDNAQSVDGYFSVNYSADIGDEYSNTSETIPHVTILGRGDDSYDYYKFTVTNAPSKAIFDIDYGFEHNSQTAMDSDLTLYQEDGAQVVYSDDADPDYGGSGSESGLDSFFTYEFDTAGVYIIRVSTWSRSPVVAGKDYTLHVSLESALIDADGDGMSDFWEQHFGLDPGNPTDAANDNDRDGLTNLEEFIADTNPLEMDSDSDGLTDGDELNVYRSNPISNDTDSDGLADGDEVNLYATDLLNDDSDNDGLSDGEEVNAYLSDPLMSDTDADGMNDGAEAEYGFNPSLFESHNTLDSDNDTLTNLEEIELGTNPSNSDTDGDGLSDSNEINIYSTDPIMEDTESDGMADGWEIDFGLNPLINDAEDDYDRDEYSNLEEFLGGTDPTDPASHPIDIIGYSIDDYGSLYQFNLTVGTYSVIGSLGVEYDFKAIAIHPDGGIYAAENSNQGLYKIDPNTGAASFVGYLNVHVSEKGMTFDDEGNLYLIDHTDLYQVDIETGESRLIGSHGLGYVDNIAYTNSKLYIIPALGQPMSLFEISITDASATYVSELPLSLSGAQTGLSADQFGNLWLLDEEGTVYRLENNSWELLDSISIPYGFESLGIQRVQDTDLDGMSDWWELQYGLDPEDLSDANLDADNDHLTNLEEYFAGSSPLLIDTDDDGLSDADEVNTYLTNPAMKDTDEDGLEDNIEILEQSDPLTVDTDSDGISDGYEHRFGLNLLEYDSREDFDNDGLNNYLEFQLGTPANFSNIDHTEDNSSFETARNLNTNFTQLYSPNVGNRRENTSESTPYVSVVGIGSNAYDYYSFSSNESNQEIIIDVDNATFDTIIRLYDSNLQQIAMNDDSNIEDGQRGSESNLDSYLEYTLASADTYYVSVERYSDSYIDSGAIYQLHISVPGAVVNDSDQDGIPDEFEIANGLDYSYAADSLSDEDGDGLNNYWEYVRGTNRLVADTDSDGIIDSEDDAPLDGSVGEGIAPVFGELSPIEIEATGTLTRVTLPQPEVFDVDPNVSIRSDVSGTYALGEYIATWEATDFVGNTSSATQTFRVVDTTPPEIDISNEYSFYTVHSTKDISDDLAGYAYDHVDGARELFFASGSVLRTGFHTVDVSSEDASGNIATQPVNVYIYPSIQVAKKMYAEPGSFLEVEFPLSGAPPFYPVELSFGIYGDSGYYYESIEEGQLIKSKIWIPETMSAGDQMKLYLSWGNNAGIDSSLSQMTIEIIEDNRPPQIQLQAYQNGRAVTVIDKSAGNVTLEVTWKDVNSSDQIEVYSHSVNTEVSQGDVTTSSAKFVLDPSDLQENLKAEFSIVETNTSEKYAVTSTIELSVIASLPLLGDTDSDNDGISDVDEGAYDDDLDGIPNYLDINNVPNRLPTASGMRDIVAAPGLRLSLGSLVLNSYGINAANGGIQIEDLSFDADSSIPPYGSTDASAALQPVNFKVSGLAENGESAQIVIPLDKPITSSMEVRKFSTELGWYNFVEDSRNEILSTNLDDEGNCPTIGSYQYVDGLSVGAECLMLRIEDGGPNDADGLQNGQIEDPVYVAAVASTSPNAVLAGPEAVDEGTSFELDASRSYDPDGEELSFTWEQLDGPDVSIGGQTSSVITLSAPDVPSDSSMQFKVTVSDGYYSHTATLSVSLLDVPDNTQDDPVTQQPEDNPPVNNQNPTGNGSSSGGGGSAGYMWYLLMLVALLNRKTALLNRSCRT
ncbi:S8 family serine peptidase [Alteromonas sp. ASW11-130]|uniref:S8 family serine peptidase n=1 Tax=Alteromonas sp. ASW11-130 TaxID=3015775 RepID=UPI0022428BDD|nr:S8 family serine peptidase [Alteromonas sp. ASW11-130]MCW8092843.1 S8 family serine peptidase [Alteromonas sp. ASW11-130]